MRALAAAALLCVFLHVRCQSAGSVDAETGAFCPCDCAGMEEVSRMLQAQLNEQAAKYSNDIVKSYVSEIGKGCVPMPPHSLQRRSEGFMGCFCASLIVYLGFLLLIMLYSMLCLQCVTMFLPARVPDTDV